MDVSTNWQRRTDETYILEFTGNEEDVKVIYSWESKIKGKIKITEELDGSPMFIDIEVTRMFYGEVTGTEYRKLIYHHFTEKSYLVLENGIISVLTNKDFHASFGPTKDFEDTKDQPSVERTFMDIHAKYPQAIRDAVDVLNSALEADPDGIKAAIQHKFPANNALVEHPTIQCGRYSNGVGHTSVFGIINGLFGVDHDMWGFIYADINEGTGEVERFGFFGDDDGVMLRRKKMTDS